MPAFQVRLLTSTDAEVFVRLRRRALQEEPLAFSASPEDARAANLDSVRAMLGDPGKAAIFGAFAPQMIGAVGIYRDAEGKGSHKAHVWGMYVAPEHRRAGAGKELLQAAIAHTRALPSVRQVQLSVSEATPAARRLHERCGFVAWGREEEALCHEWRTFAEDHMALRLGSRNRERA